MNPILFYIIVQSLRLAYHLLRFWLLLAVLLAFLVCGVGAVAEIMK